MASLPFYHGFQYTCVLLVIKPCTLVLQFPLPPYLTMCHAGTTRDCHRPLQVYLIQKIDIPKVTLLLSYACQIFFTPRFARLHQEA